MYEKNQLYYYNQSEPMTIYGFISVSFEHKREKHNTKVVSAIKVTIHFYRYFVNMLRSGLIPTQSLREVLKLCHKLFCLFRLPHL